MNIYALVHPYEEVTIKTEELVLMEDLDERIWRKASSYHQQQPASQQNAAQPTVSPPSTVNPSDTQQQPSNAQPPPPFQSVLRLHDDPAQPAPPPPKASRKRKTPPTAQEQQPPPQPPPPGMHPPPGVMPPPPPHPLMHPPHMGPPPPLPFQYIPQDYTPGGLTHPPPLPPGHQGGSPPQDGAARPLSQSKRAEQNRKAQRAFRERRDQHVKALESRSQLLDAALASADEANRRWEDCRQLVDQLRIENAALRTLISQLQSSNPHPLPPPQPVMPPSHQSEPAPPAANGENQSTEGTGAAPP